MRFLPIATSLSIHTPFLRFRQGLFAKIAAVISLAAILLYALDDPLGMPNGGTWLGYFFGSVGLGLIFWLAWFGIRRRRYGGTGASLEAWLSAHVYLGLAAILIACLHTGFRLHWNLHGIAFGLMVGVIASGMVGVFAFWLYPPLMTRNRAGATFAALAAQLAALDVQCRNLALTLDDPLVELIFAATEEPAGKLTPGEIFLGRPGDPLSGASGRAITALRNAMGGSQSHVLADIQPVIQALTNRAVLLERMRRDKRFRLMMQAWRAVHVPLTIGLLIALTIHVFAVFYYR
jgi:hypothetical protein